MSKFDVGDNVKIREDLIYNHYYGDIRCSSKRLECRGKIGEITKIAKTGSYFVHNHWFSEEMLEACDSKNTSKFKFEKDDNVESLYPYMIDIKTCGKNLLDNYKIQTDFYNKYIKCIWKKEEEKDMNKVLNLWCERKRNKIIDRYDKMECEFYNNKYSVVASFKELIEKFNNDLEDLYKLDKVTEQFVLKENAPNNVIKYCLDEEKLNEEFKKEYLSKRDEEFNALRDIRDEVEAQLSLSNDLEYQQEVLIRYGIIDKKTKKIAD